MVPEIKVNLGSKLPIYKQLLHQIENAIHSGTLQVGEQLPSMNELSESAYVSKETVKKTYGLLREKGLIVPKQGKGFFVADISADAHPQVLVLFDIFSIFKNTLFNAFSTTLGERADITVLVHNQDVELLEYFLDTYLDQFDYYVVTPHFPLDEETQQRVMKQISRIPNPKLILMDRLLPDYPGNIGAVYQDFGNDIYYGLVQALDRRMEKSGLKVIILPSSLYGDIIRRSVERFCREYNVPVKFLTGTPASVSKRDTYLIVGSQSEAGLVELARRINARGLHIGTDVRILSFNEIEMNELILGGLSTLSTDFRQMGRLAAEMILDKHVSKVHCDFRLTRRNTF
jgi:DNA-binding transcriptional regulator YhcF (GntR family)